MNEAGTATPGLPPPPDPPKDRSARPLPPATVELLIQVQVLLVYARHLRGLLAQVAERGFSLAAQCFGSVQAAFVLTNLTRGILRAIALERVLLARTGGEPDAAAGKPRKRMPQAARQSASRAQRPSRDRVLGLPTLRQLEAAIRRRPVESAIDEIRHDLGVSFSLCEARFGNALRDMVVAYRDSLASVFKQCLPRAADAAGAPERDLAFDLPPRKPDAIRYIVGWFIDAQQPVCGLPFTASPVGAATAGAQPP
jgi:hypothetical protein